MFEDISSLLTSKQRAYLKGDSDIEENSSHARAVRGRIRKRVEAGLWDLQTLQGKMEPRDIKQTFSDTPTFQLIPSAIAFLLDGPVRLRMESIDEEVHLSDEGAAEYLSYFITEAIERLYARHEIRIEEIDVDINIEVGDSFDTEDPEKLSIPELVTLHNEGEISEEKFIDILMEKGEQE